MNVKILMEIFKSLFYLFLSLWIQKFFHNKVRLLHQFNSVFKLYLCGKSKFRIGHFDLSNSNNILSLKIISHHEIITDNGCISYKLSRWHIVINRMLLMASKFRLHGMWIEWDIFIINWKSFELKRPWIIYGIYIWYFCLPVHEI